MGPDSDKPFSAEGYALMAAAFEVHDTLGGGLLEEIYQESLTIELSLRGIPFVAKQQLEVFYKGHLLEKRYIPDLVVFDGIVVELKSASALAPEHEAQLLNYMRITRHPWATSSTSVRSGSSSGNVLCSPNSAAISVRQRS